MKNKKYELEVFKKTKHESYLMDLAKALKEMKKIHDEMKKEGFSEEFIAIFLASATKG
jgi:hypothetical protein